MKKSGFTLLELILAIAILSIVTLIIGSGFRLGINAWERGESEATETQRLRVLSGLMTQQLKSAYPYRMEIEGKMVEIFRGSPNSVLFVTSLVDSSYGGFKWVRYVYEDGILKYKEGILPDKGLFERLSGDEEILESDIGEVRFTYLSSDGKEWKDSWEFGDGLPGAVRVKIAYFEPFLITIPMGSVVGRGML
jgi:general secretion pathway protein J